jgi:hypothetical protein
VREWGPVWVVAWGRECEREREVVVVVAVVCCRSAPGPHQDRPPAVRQGIPPAGILVTLS